MKILNQFGVGAKYRADSRAVTSQGFPLMGNATPNLTQEEYDNIPHGVNANVKVFDLGNSSDLEEYTQILDKIVNGLFRLIDRTKLISEDGKEIRLHLEWGEVVGIIPKNVQRRL